LSKPTKSPEDNRTAVLAALTPDVLTQSKYPLVAAAVQGKGIDLAIVLDGVDYAAIDMAKPETMAMLDARIAGIEHYLATQGGPKPSPPAPTPAPAPQNPAGLLPPPALPDQSTADTPQFIADADFDADFARHLQQRARVRKHINPGPLSQRRS
jgi:hypothetical protein